jgi:hypothetical protein
MKLVWEKASCVQVEIEIADLPVHPPREWDTWLMQEFVRLNYSSEDLQRLNRVQVHQEVLFLSDVMVASSRVLDRNTSNKDHGRSHGQTCHFQSNSPPKGL